MGATGRWLAVAAVLVLAGLAGTARAEPTLPFVDSERAAAFCPTDDFRLERSLPAGSQPTVELDPSTIAQPRGGTIRFLIHNWPTPVFQNSFTVCFRWRSSGQPSLPIMQSPVPARVVSVNGKEVVIAAIVPNLPSTHTRLWEALESLGLVENGHAGMEVHSHTLSNLAPIADVLLRIHDDAGNHLDVAVGIGVSSQSFAIVVTLALLSLILLFLWRVRENGHPDVPAPSVFLRVIATRDGRAALSQFQIMLWSLVVGGGAIYVMMLTGDLIEVSTGTLVLLGISGSATLAAQVSGRAAASAPRVARTPRWSDLVTSGDDGEIDVTRLQMLFFTVITALFVTIKIVASYTIPEIPDGFLVLMGISNGVYVSKKFIPAAQPPAATS